MNTINLTVKSEVYNCNIEFSRRIIVIKGDSGTGKTTLAELISSNIDGVSITSSYKVAVLTEADWKVMMKSNKDMIFIFDDLTLVSTPEFASVVKSTICSNNLYLILISRERFTDLNSVGRLAFCSNDIYKMVYNGKEHYLEKFHSVSECSFESNPIDCFLVEDKKAGYQFFDKITSLPCFSATSGKSSVTEDIERLSKDYKHIFVVLDTASFGCHMEEFFNKCTYSITSEVSYMSDYECFEELLAQTNLLNKIDLVKEELSNISKYANKKESWEKYFEDLVGRVTYSKYYKHTHTSDLKDCYYKDCCECNPYKAKKCDGILDGSKFEALLRGTKYERILNL